MINWKPSFSVNKKINMLIKKKHKTNSFNFFLSISDEKKYSIAFCYFSKKIKVMKKFITENLKTLIYALIIALIIRSLIIQPFYIPSSSMEPSLLVGDRLFVSKYSYGYSKILFLLAHQFLKEEFF